MLINVIEYLIKTVEKYPNKIAFEDKNSEITYQKFNKVALHISTEICKYTNQINSPIGIFLPKSISALTSFMGTLYSGNIYMPLDIKNPIERLQGIINNIEPIIIITDQSNVSKLKQLSFNGKILIYEDIISNTKNFTTRYKEIIDTDGAYIINTSGSTGTPKGVLISHRSIIDYIEWATKEYNITNSEIIGNQAPFYFDNSVLDIYLTLKNACKLIITPENLFIFQYAFLCTINSC